MSAQGAEGSPVGQPPARGHPHRDRDQHRPFGAFVDLGGADGLIHLSELAWHRVGHPSEVVQVGQEVEVYVMNVDPENKRIGLSLRRMTPEPWSVVATSMSMGQVVAAQITRLMTFGAFAKIDDTIEGLIHISEMARLPHQSPQRDRPGRRRGAGADHQGRSAEPARGPQPAPGQRRHLCRSGLA